MSGFERGMRRREAKQPYKLIDHLIREQVPDAMAEYGLESSGEMLRTLAKVEDERGAYLACQALATFAIAHSAMALRALELLDDAGRSRLVADSPPLEDIMEALE